MGPALNVGSPQSSLAPALLNFVREVLLRDEAYLERIKRHYHLFRAKIDGKRKTGTPQSKRLPEKKS